MEHRRRCSHGQHHQATISKQSLLALGLCLLLINVVLAEISRYAEDPTHYNRRLRWGDISPENEASTHEEHAGSSILGRRLMQAEYGNRNTLKLRVLHRNSMDSPARKEFGSREEEIEDLIAMDEMRVKGFSAVNLKLGREDGDNTLPSPSPAFASPPISGGAPSTLPEPSPSPSNYEEFLGRVVSGASFPGNIGQYFVEFSIGSPPQPFLFIADTGSDLVWVPCSLCTDCINKIPPISNDSVFLTKNSSTFSPIACSAQECDLIPPPVTGSSSCSAKRPTSCTYGYSYTDSSQTTGIFAYDTITMSTSSGKRVKIKNVAFGCGTNNTGPSITKLGGVIGLGQGPISFSSQVGYMYGSKFSYCFTSFFNRKASSALVFGDDLEGTSELKSTMQYTPFLPNAQSETFYYIGIDGVEVAGERLPIPPEIWSIKKDGNGGAVIDSGTTLTFFVRPAYELIVEAIKKVMHYPLAPPTAGLPICYNVSGVSEPQLPQLTILFKGDAVFKPPTKNYFLSPKDELRCLGFLGSGGLTVLGNLLQQNYHVEYDRLHNRLGFAKAHCSLA
ncbi:hypothetical protein GOP47_0009913 [Adiantum capillus-veneris]|uniref:Peptidase A1 domain-containing protein n=1 Tax=Adiantum capillus-veneris TaxID=13818 RepID=A0A9D4UYN0_ADICA|nr:hypothetical protein GOP47_0009913 [Adiantum capillus-veneris]